MSRRITYTPEALRDLDQTGGYSKRVWGAAQARKYIARLVTDIKSLSDDALHHPLIEGVYPGLRRKRSGMHHIYFLASDSRVEILSLLHVQRDPGALLSAVKFDGDIGNS